MKLCWPRKSVQSRGVNFLLSWEGLQQTTFSFSLLKKVLGLILWLCGLNIFLRSCSMYFGAVLSLTRVESRAWGRYWFAYGKQNFLLKENATRNFQATFGKMKIDIYSKMYHKRRSPIFDNVLPNKTVETKVWLVCSKLSFYCPEPPKTSPQK